MSHNDLTLVRSIVELLTTAGLDVGLFGGWAEELRGLRAAGPHADIDLLLRSPSFDQLDVLLSARADLGAIPAKRFSHKRALVWRGVRVEIFLAQPGEPATSSMFDGRFTVAWPADTFPCDGAANARAHDEGDSARPEARAPARRCSRGPVFVPRRGGAGVALPPSPRAGTVLLS